MAKRTLFNLRQISEKKYVEIDLGEEFSSLMGKPEARFAAMAYGPSGSGKSVFALRLANEFSKRYGKTLYVSHEEAANKTLRDRIAEYGIDSKKLWIADQWSFEKVLEKNRTGHYRLLVFDSVQYMRFTPEQLKTLFAAFPKRKMAVLLISFGSSKPGSTDGANKLLHACDVKLHFYQGQVYSHGRYIKHPIKKQLFKAAQAVQGGLF